MANQRFVEVGVKLHLNGFPKSGLHAMDEMAARLLGRGERSKPEDWWLGSFAGHGFASQWIDKNKIIERINNMPYGYRKGHMGHTPEIARAFKDNHIAQVFIFRDFRDVAVSAAKHVTSDNERLPAPAKEFMKTLDFDTALEVIISGEGVYAPLMERWEQYAPWLEEEGVMRVCFGDLITNPEGWAHLFVRYVYGRTASYVGENVELDRETFDNVTDYILEGFEHKGGSPTYTEGKKIGKWRDYFTNKHKELFKQTDKNNWLTKLGFEEDNDW